MPDTFDPARIQSGYWLFLTTALVLIAGMLWLSARLNGRWRDVVRLLVVIGSVRLLIIGNPIAWHYYAQHLNGSNIGWRQAGAMLHQRDQFNEPAAGTRYLAVGSSQTDAIYGPLAHERDDLDTFTIPGMLPLDFVLYREWIARKRPEHILLYLSDFDIARRPPPTAITIAPAQGWRILDVWGRLRTLPDRDAYRQPFADLVIGEIFPEYKYRFVFRGLLSKAMWYVAATVGRVMESTATPSADDVMIQAARETMSAEYIPFNMALLREYLAYATVHSNVVIVEGHYNPRVFTPATEHSAALVSAALTALADSMERVIYTPRAAVHAFDEADYFDLSHVNEQAGTEFATRAIEFVERTRAQQEADPLRAHR